MKVITRLIYTNGKLCTSLPIGLRLSLSEKQWNGQSLFKNVNLVTIIPTKKMISYILSFEVEINC